MMGDIKKMQEELRKQAKPDVRPLHDEIERLTSENAELRNQPPPAAETGPELLAMLEENVRLHRELEAKGNSIIDDDITRQLEDLRAEIALLSEELQNKEQIIQEIQQQTDASPDPELEAELEQLRGENGLLKQLEERSSAPEPEEPHRPQGEQR